MVDWSWPPHKNVILMNRLIMNYLYLWYGIRNLLMTVTVVEQQNNCLYDH